MHCIYQNLNNIHYKYNFSFFSLIVFGGHNRGLFQLYLLTLCFNKLDTFIISSLLGYISPITF